MYGLITVIHSQRIARIAMVNTLTKNDVDLGSFLSATLVGIRSIDRIPTLYLGKFL